MENERADPYETNELPSVTVDNIEQPQSEQQSQELQSAEMPSGSMLVVGEPEDEIGLVSSISTQPETADEEQ